uniref:NF-X1-type zinc finger protein NFXL1 n=1 Tax=Lygus hesperus TaxID=30085 RepID=A0A0A9Z153_LYGHE
MVFALTVIGTPLSMIDISNTPACYTLWGYKPDCGQTGYSLRGRDAFQCGHRRSVMYAGAAFAIISIFNTLMAFILCAFMALRVIVPKYLALFFAMWAVITLCIAWACPAAVFHRRMCNNGPYKSTGRFGAGFALLVTAFGLQILLLPLICLTRNHPRPCTPCTPRTPCTPCGTRVVQC